MAMRHARNVDKCNSFECYLPQEYHNVGNHVCAFSTWRTVDTNRK